MSPGSPSSDLLLASLAVAEIKCADGRVRTPRDAGDTASPVEARTRDRGGGGAARADGGRAAAFAAIGFAAAVVGPLFVAVAEVSETLTGKGGVKGRCAGESDRPPAAAD